MPLAPMPSHLDNASRGVPITRRAWLRRAGTTLGAGVTGTGLLTAGLSATAGGCGGAVPAAFRPQGELDAWSDEDWAFVLNRVVTVNGLVDHVAVRENRDGVFDALRRYCGRINAASPENRPELFPTPDDGYAYYINAYNALCMLAIQNRNLPRNVLWSGGVPGSIFFVDTFPVGGRRLTLDALEKRRVAGSRDGDPRFHFAVNCMSYSCPPLRREPYVGASIDEQLDDQGLIYLSDDRAVRAIDDETVGLNDIFTSFYTGDFVRPYRERTGDRSAGLLEALRPYAAADSPLQTATRFRGIGYDWSLNTP